MFANSLELGEMSSDLASHQASRLFATAIIMYFTILLSVNLLGNLDWKSSDQQKRNQFNKLSSVVAETSAKHIINQILQIG